MGVGEALAPILTMETEWDQAKLEKRWGDVTVAGFFLVETSSSQMGWLEIFGICMDFCYKWYLMIVRLNGVLFKLY